jgi:hypothetical protein
MDRGSGIRGPRSRKNLSVSQILDPGSRIRNTGNIRTLFSASARQRVSQDAGQEENYREENVSKATFSEPSHLG